MSNCDDIRLFCNGYYAEILVMDPFSLEIIFSLSSKVKPDWISALHVSHTFHSHSFLKIFVPFGSSESEELTYKLYNSLNYRTC